MLVASSVKLSFAFFTWIDNHCISGEFLGLYSPWGHKELDTTERLSLTHSLTHSDLCEISHCTFDLQFSNNERS